jgi:hypothetical protein
MKTACALFAGMLILLYLAPCGAGEGEVGQLKAEGTYEAALRAKEVEQPSTFATVSSALPNNGSRTADELTHEFRMTQQREKVYISVILGALALAAHFMALRFVRGKTESKGADSAPHIVNVTGLVYIIFGTIILVVLASTEQQLTAAIGILGAVAGYLFGTLPKGVMTAQAQSTESEK